jgi:DNA-binding LacI/PurR family transcriptional regulator/DNA-binding CsgD family transcriptional regulator
MPKTIALLINQIDGSYQKSFWQAAAAESRERGINLLVLAGGSLDSPVGNEARGNLLFQTVPKINPAGLILLSGALSPFVDSRRYGEFVRSLGDIPRVSVSDDRGEGIIVKTDNRPGLENLLAHLGEVHHLTRLAFVQGPPVSSEARERLSVFRDFCSSRNLSVPEDWLPVGNFRPESGLAAIRSILDSPSGIPQAVVFANDDMLFGALDEIRRRRIRVPEDLVITGFDDIGEMSRLKPGVTTVRQPLELLGRAAVALISDRTDGREVPPVTGFPTEAVIRETCGCRAIPQPVIEPFLIPRDYPLETFIRYLRNFISRGQGAQSRAGMYDALQDFARNLSLPPFSLYLFRQPVTHPLIAGTLEPEFSHDKNREADSYKPVPVRGGVTWNRLPEDLAARGLVHLVMPLNNLGEYYGLIVFHDPEPADDPLIFDSLREAVGGVLHARFLFERLEEKEKHYRELAFRLPAALAETDQTGRLVYLNDAADKLFAAGSLNGGSPKNPPLLDSLFPVSEQDRFRELLDRIRTLRDDQFATFDIGGIPWLFKGEIEETRIRWLGISLKPFLETLDLPVERFYQEFRLSKRERQILELVIHGCRSKEIAERLNLALSTVKNYLSGIYSALDISTREELFELIREYQVNRLGQEKYLHSVLGALLKSGGN